MKRFFKTALLCIILNITLSLLSGAIMPSIFLDTVFTVAITFYCGLVPGLVVAATYNPIMTVLRSLLAGGTGTASGGIFYYDFLYALCGIFIVIVTWAFSRNKKEFYFSKSVTLLYLLIIAFLSAFISSFAASALDAFVRPLFKTHSDFSAVDYFALAFQKMKFNAFLSYLLPRIPITILDRLISTFAGFGIYRLAEKFERMVQGGKE